MAVPVKTQVCLAHSAVSNSNHKQMSEEVEGESKCMWCSPWHASHPLPVGSDNTVCVAVLVMLLLQVHSVIPGSVRGGTSAFLAREKLPCGSPELCALSVLN